MALSKLQNSQERIAAEHRRLGDLMVRIEWVAQVAEVEPLVAELKELLPRHFAREQAADGLFSIIRHRTPDHQERVDQLELDHGALLKALEQLGAKDRPDRDQLEEIAAFTTQLREHEKAESKLLIEALGNSREQGS